MPLEYGYSPGGHFKMQTVPVFHCSLSYMASQPLFRIQLHQRNFKCNESIFTTKPALPPAFLIPVGSMRSLGSPLTPFTFTINLQVTLISLHKYLLNSSPFSSLPSPELLSQLWVTVPSLVSLPSALPLPNGPPTVLQSVAYHRQCGTVIRYRLPRQTTWVQILLYYLLAVRP